MMVGCHLYLSLINRHNSKSHGVLEKGKQHFWLKEEEKYFCEIHILDREKKKNGMIQSENYLKGNDHTE